MQLGVALRNARGNSIESTVGTSPILRILDGSAPANCAAAETGTILAQMTLPSDWYNAFSGGAGSKAGTWEDLLANATGTAGYWRLYDSGVTVCHKQGSVGVGSGDLQLNSLSIVSGLPVTVTAWNLTEGNA